MLRELKVDDANGMLEWMKDLSVTKGFGKDFSSYSIDDCKDFILKNELNYATNKPKEIHFAVTDETDKYKGTVSLKYINYQYGAAEFAIVLIKSAQGTGLAQTAFNDIVNYSFNKLHLKYIYFSCKKDNVAANKFYSKMGAELISYDKLKIKNTGNIQGYDNDVAHELYWYILDNFSKN